MAFLLPDSVETGGPQNSVDGRAMLQHTGPVWGPILEKYQLDLKETEAYQPNPNPLILQMTTRRLKDSRELTQDWNEKSSLSHRPVFASNHELAGYFIT